MGPNLLHGNEDISSLHNIHGPSIAPFAVGTISPWKEMNFPLLTFPILSLDCAVELAVGEILLEHVYHVVEVNEEVIDSNRFHFVRAEGSSGN